MISISVPNEPRAIAAAEMFFKALGGQQCATVNFNMGDKVASLPRVDSTSIDPLQVAPEPTTVFAPPMAPVVVGDSNEPEIVVPAPSPSSPVIIPGVQLDSAGTPWDSRIHSSSKAFVADGTWRLRRNLDPNILAAVKAELGQAMSAPAPIIPAAPVVPPQPPVAPTAPVVLTFPGLLQKITAAGITKEQASAAAVKLGLPSFALVATRPDLLPAMAAELGVA